MSEIEPGYYWAQWNTGEWEPVEVFCGEGEKIRVRDIINYDHTDIEEWVLGPRLEPPEEK